MKPNKLLYTLSLFFIDNIAFGQQTGHSGGMNPTEKINIVLLLFSFFLLIPMWVFPKILVFVIQQKRLNKIAKTATGLCIILIPFLTQAENIKMAETTQSLPLNWVSWVIIGIIAIQMLIIIVFAFNIVSVLGDSNEQAQKNRFSLRNWLQTKWQKINNFRPLSEEADLDTGHSYDGIRELDNVTPTWFTTAFIISIIFSISYLYRYHIAQSAPLQEEEFQIEMETARIEKEEYLKKQANSIDENNVVLLKSSTDLEEGKHEYEAKCAVCHSADGGGGVGPNLTDAYWLHGGSLQDIFKSVKYGWQEKGMKSWKDDFSPKQLAQISSYIVSMKGKKTAMPKEPQGEMDIKTKEIK